MRQQILLPRVEEEKVFKPPSHRQEPPTLRGRLRVRGADMHLRKRQVRVDYGRSILLEVWFTGSSVLTRNLGTRRICPQTTLHLQPDLQANAGVQAVGLRVIRTFCPLKRVLYEVLGKFSAGGNSLNCGRLFKDS
jgi:hypothetical protein